MKQLYDWVVVVGMALTAGVYALVLDDITTGSVWWVGLIVVIELRGRA